jgi:hypothetical protein
MRLLTTVALLSFALALAGCGSAPSPTVAHLSPGTSTSSASSEGGASSSASTVTVQQAEIAYAKCMRSNGVPNFPGPKSEGGFLFNATARIDPSSPAFKAAQAKCHKLLPDGGPPGPGASTHPSAETLARMLSIARCMRRHGVYDFPDPRTSVPANPFGSGGNGVISDIEGVILVFPNTIDEQSPTFAHAASRCAFPLHNH